MPSTKMIAFTLVLVFLCSFLLAAEEKLGIPVYNGAQYDARVSKGVSTALSASAFCYRTNDSLNKVMDFYKKQAGFKLMGSTPEGAMFKKGATDLTVQNPWMNMEAGKMMKDTLITIVKNN